MAKQSESLEKVSSTEITTRNITNAVDTKYLADDLAKFIKENKLFSNIQGKEFVSVEGWQYVGTRLGYVPIVEAIENRCVDKIFKYQVTVRLMDLRTDKTVGMGVALCSNEESTKKYYPEYAILSMAQTRAVGKAYRNMLAWIIRAAGYMPTPAEEMEEMQAAEVVETNKARKAEPTKPIQAAKTALETPDAIITDASEIQALVDTASQLKSVDDWHRFADKFRAWEGVEGFDLAMTEAYARVKALPLLITNDQKTQILLLLNNSAITKDEKDKMVAKLSGLDKERAGQAITKLKKVINERTSDTSTSNQAA